MNRLIGNKYIATKGKDNALKIAAALLENDYQVFIQLDASNIYIVAYTDNNTDYGGDEFALLDDNEQELILNNRSNHEDVAALDRVNELIDQGLITEKDLHLQK